MVSSKILVYIQCFLTLLKRGYATDYAWMIMEGFFPFKKVEFKILIYLTSARFQRQAIKISKMKEALGEGISIPIKYIRE